MKTKSGEVIYRSEQSSLQAVVVEAVKMGMDLSGADLSGADLGRADLRGADLGRADLWGTQLWGAVIDHDTDLTDCEVDEDTKTDQLIGFLMLSGITPEQLQVMGRIA